MNKKIKELKHEFGEEGRLLCDKCKTPTLLTIFNPGYCEKCKKCGTEYKN